MRYFPKNKNELKMLLDDESISLADINTSKISDMSYLFTPNTNKQKYKNLTIKDKEYKDRFCTRTNFDGIETWDTSRVVDMRGMFKGCVYFNKKLNFNTSRVVYMDEMFMDCFRFDSGICFDTSGVLSMKAMFKNCFKFNQALNYDMGNVENTEEMFKNCFKLNQEINLNCPYLDNATAMFYSCRSLNKKINIKAPHLSVTSYMFSNCYNLNSEVYIKTDKISFGICMFSECFKLDKKVVLDIKEMVFVSDMFKNCHSLSISPKIDFKNVIHLNEMFYKCKALKSVDDFCIKDTAIFQNVFAMCESLKTPPIIKDLVGFYRGCFELKNVPKQTLFEKKPIYEDGKMISYLNEKLLNITLKDGKFIPKNKDELKLLINEDYIRLDRIDVGLIDDFSYIFILDDEFIDYLKNNQHKLLNIIKLSKKIKTRKDFRGIDTWDLTNAKNCDFMFAWCKNLNKSLNFDTKNLVSAKAMFLHCKNLQSAPKLNTKNVKDFSFMFEGCKNLKILEKTKDYITLQGKKKAPDKNYIKSTLNISNVKVNHAELVLNDNILEHLIEPLRYLEFVKKNGFAPSLSSINESLKECIEVLILSVFYNPQDIKLIDILDKSVVLAALSSKNTDYAVLKDISVDDFKLCVYAVMQNPKNLDYVPKNIANDKDFINECDKFCKNPNLFDFDEYFDKTYIKVQEVLRQDFLKHYPKTNEELKFLIRDKNISLKSIDIRYVDDLSYAFEYVDRYDIDEVLKWDFTHVKSMKAMFKNAIHFNFKICFQTPNVSDFSEMFYGCESLNSSIELDFSSAINAKSMFEKCTNLNQKIILKNSSKLENVSNMFAYAKQFNQKLELDTSSVINFSNMFRSAKSFNQELDFDTKNARDFSGMFCAASSFDKPLNFDTKNAKTMAYMFCTANVFNQELDFNTENVEDMKAMFCRAFAFNKPLKFNTKKVKNMERMFENTYNFNQELDFDTTSLKSATDMFYLARAYDKPIKIWQS